MDIDVDVPATFNPTKIFPGAVRASRVQDGRLLPHPCGIYFQEVPIDPLTKLAAPPYDVAEDLGCFKIDFLHVPVYDKFKSKDEIRALLEVAPDWSLLQIPSVVAKLFQVSKHHEILAKVKPTSVMQLADCLAIIRPGKRHLLDRYLGNPRQVRQELYQKVDGDVYGFKKAHALAYALVIVLQLHLAKENLL